MWRPGQSQPTFPKSMLATYFPWLSIPPAAKCVLMISESTASQVSPSAEELTLFIGMSLDSVTPVPVGVHPMATFVRLRAFTTALAPWPQVIQLAS